VRRLRAGRRAHHQPSAVAGQHLNNVVIYTPYFFEGELACVRDGARALDRRRRHEHRLRRRPEVGDPWLEGLQLDQLKIYEAGVPDETLYA
jgi:N-methylhydantoinase B